jgi:hypothetical protein
MASRNKPRNHPGKPAAAPSRPAAAQPRPAVKARPSAPEPERTHTFAPGFWRGHALAALLLMALSFGLYALSLRFGYVLDDQMVIWDNMYVQKGFAGLREIFAYDSFMGYLKNPQFLLEGGRYRPLSLATFAAEVGIFGKDHPNISHFINVLLYGLTGVLLYRILLGLFPLAEGGKWYFSVPFIGALLFVAHPLHVECVANIKGRDEILALLGSLGALYATLKYFDTRRVVWLAASGVLLFLGMLAKENALTFVAVIPLTVWFFARVPAGRAVAAAIPLVAAALLFVIVRFQALGYLMNPGKELNDLMNNPFLGMTAGERLATIFLTLGWYLKLLLLPHPLTHDYYPYHVPKVGWSDWRPLLSLALYAGMAVWAAFNLRRRSVPAYAILFYLITLSIVSNLLVSVGTFMNERFLYMPSVAFCILAAWFLARKMPEWFKEKPDAPYLLGGALVVMAIGLYGWRVWTRVPDWKDAFSLNVSAVRNSPNSARAHCFYVTALYEGPYKKAVTPEQKSGLVDTMEYHINRSLQINPDYSSAWIMKGAVSAARFELDKQMDKLFHDFEIVLDHIPNSTNFRNFLYSYLEYLGTRGGNPNKLASFCYRIGYERFYLQLKDAPTAIKIMEYALLNQTEDEQVLTALAEVYQATGNAAKAAEMRQRAEASKNVIWR